MILERSRVAGTLCDRQGYACSRRAGPAPCWTAQQAASAGEPCTPAHRCRAGRTQGRAARLRRDATANASDHSTQGTVGAESVPDDRTDAAGPSGAFAAGVAGTPAFLRRAAGSSTLNDLLDLLFAEASADGLTDEDCRAIILAALERGNTSLAVAVFDAMRRTATGSGGALDGPGGPRAGTGWAWPPSSLDTACALVLGLTRCLCVKEALDVVAGLRAAGGAAQPEEVRFGHLVPSPLARGTPLAVVQPQEGVKQVACAASRYEYELYSGTVTRVDSEALVAGQALLLAAARAVGLLRRPAAGAVHELVVTLPGGGGARSFRLATATADVPASVGDRVTVVCCPQRAARQRLPGLPPTPPGRKPGEPLLLSNHTTRVDADMLRPPPAAGERLPGWVVPAAVLLAGSDAASWLVDPAMPLMLAAGAAGAAASVAAGTQLLLPRLRQLPETALAAEAARSKLLSQHSVLAARLAVLGGEAADDITLIARLWQLQSKMGSVGGGSSAYEERSGRVGRAVEALEARLGTRLRLIDGYARVLAMIEIEVELEAQVPAEELLGIEEQIQKLEEVEEMQEELQLQAEAQDEVEKLLRAV